MASNIMQGFGIEASQMGKVSDILTKAFTSSNVTLEMMSESLKYVGPNAAAAGYSLEEMAAATGLLGNAGIQASMAGTSLRGMIERFSGPVPAASKLMKELGIEVINTDGTMKSLADIVEEVTKGTADLGEAQRLAAVKTLVGSRASASFLALMDVGPETIREFTKELENSGGVAQEIAERQLDNLEGSFLLLKSALEGVAIALSYGLTPAIRFVADVITSLLTSFNNLTENTKAFIGVLGAVTAALALFVGPMLMLVALIPSLVGGMAALGGVFGLTAGAFTLVALKVAAVIAAIIGIPIALYIAYQEFEWFRNAVGATWDAIVVGAQWAWDALKVGAEYAVAGIVAAFNGLSALAGVIGGWVSAAVSAIGAAFAGVGSFIGGLLDALGPIGTYVRDSFSTIEGVLLTVTPLITRFGIGLLGLTGPVGTVIAVLASVGIALYKFISGNEAAQQAFISLWENAKTAFSIVMNALGPIFEIFTSAFDDLVSGLAPEFTKTVEAISAAIGSLGATFTDAGSQLSASFSGAREAVASNTEAITKIWKLLGATILELVKSVLPILQIAFKVAFEGAASVVQSVLPVILTAIASIIPIIGIIVSEVLPALAKIFGEVFRAVVSVVSTVVPIITNVVGILAELFANVATNVLPRVLEAVQMVFTVVLSIIQAVVPVIITVIEALINVIVAVLIPTINFILDVVQAVFPYVATIIESVLNIVIGIITWFVALFTGDWQALWDSTLQILQSAWNLIVAAIQLVINLVVAVIVGAWELIKSVTVAVWNAIVAILVSVWQGIVSVVTTYINEAWALIQSVWAMIKENAQAVWNAILAIIDTVWKGILRTILTLIVEISNVISSTWETIKSTVASILAQIIRTVSNKFEEMKTAVDEKIQAVRGFIEDGWNAAVAFLEGIDLGTIGRNIIEGLARGIKNAADLVKGAVDWIADKIPGWIKDPLGIKSPSRLMRDDVGHWIPVGLAEGISGASDAVSKSVSAMAALVPREIDAPNVRPVNVARPSVAGMSGTFGFNDGDARYGGGATIDESTHVTINYTGGFGSTREQAEEIGRLASQYIAKEKRHVMQGRG